jgi:hypothetical protein
MPIKNKKSAHNKPCIQILVDAAYAPVLDPTAR